MVLIRSFNGIYHWRLSKIHLTIIPHHYIIYWVEIYLQNYYKNRNVNLISYFAHYIQDNPATARKLQDNKKESAQEIWLKRAKISTMPIRIKIVQIIIQKKAFCRQPIGILMSFPREKGSGVIHIYNILSHHP